MQLGIYTTQGNVLERWQRLLADVTPLQLSEAALSEGVKDGVLLIHLESLSPERRKTLFQALQVRGQLYAVLTDRPQDDEGIRLLALGARGYASTFITGSLLQQLIETLCRGDIWASPVVMQKLLRRLLNGQPAELLSVQAERLGIVANLSEREQQVMDILVTGASNKLIARKLEITERTVKAHISAILRKTGAGDRVSLILMAKEQERLH
ncbi:MAG: response regulator transcription factor [Oceanospirillaceae bacterium]|nr:response regulator transcription factor [Oceanospirillaceae bacterium]